MSDLSLSNSYSIATQRIHDQVTELYESLHHDDGTPVSDNERVSKSIHLFMKDVREELDMIRSACRESNEGK